MHGWSGRAARRAPESAANLEQCPTRLAVDSRVGALEALHDFGVREEFSEGEGCHRHRARVPKLRVSSCQSLTC
jgi:hypothetical protein